MGIFDKLFRKKKEEEKEKKEKIDICPICNNPIYENEEYKVFSLQGKKYIIHLKCFRKAKKIAKKFISGDIKF